MGNAHAVRASAHEFPQVGLMMSSTLSLIQTRRVRIPITVTGARISAIPSTAPIGSAHPCIPQAGRDQRCCTGREHDDGENKRRPGVCRSA